MLDEVSQAVLEREEVISTSGAIRRARRAGARAHLRVSRGIADDAALPYHRALQHPLYPILRKIERTPENLHHV
jgi:hypothetical protein